MNDNGSDKKKVSTVTGKVSIMAIKVDPVAWKQFRLYCVANNITCYEQLNKLLIQFLEEKKFHVTIEGNQNTTSQID